MQEWQPIEIAPKDGTEIILYFPRIDDMALNPCIAVGKWNPNQYSTKPKARFEVYGLMRLWASASRANGSPHTGCHC